MEEITFTIGGGVERSSVSNPTTITLTQNYTVTATIEQDIVIPSDQKLSLSASGDTDFTPTDSTTLIIPYEYNRLILKSASATSLSQEESFTLGFKVEVNGTLIYSRSGTGSQAIDRQYVIQVTPGNSYYCLLTATGRGDVWAICEFEFGKDLTPDFVL